MRENRKWKSAGSRVVRGPMAVWEPPRERQISQKVLKLGIHTSANFEPFFS